MYHGPVYGRGLCRGLWFDIYGWRGDEGVSQEEDAAEVEKEAPRNKVSA
jgi:hypothetical protein